MIFNQQSAERYGMKGGTQRVFLNGDYQSKYKHLMLQSFIMWQKYQRQFDLKHFIQQVSNDSSFRNYHNQNQQKGVFSLVKYTFDKMVKELKTFIKSEHSQGLQQIAEGIRSGKKIWRYSEYKLFAWLSIWLQFKHNYSVEKINNVEMTPLKWIFNDKPESFLRYQFSIIVSSMSPIRSRWSQEEIQYFIHVVNQQCLLCQTLEQVRWKMVSFRLFIEKNWFRTSPQCKEKWNNHINPFIEKAKWRANQDLQMLLAYQQYGPKWSLISKILKNRTEHMVKNRFNSIKRKWTNKHKSKNFQIKDILQHLKQQISKASRQQSQKQSQLKIALDVEKLLQQPKEQINFFKSNEVHRDNLLLSFADVGICENQNKDSVNIVKGDDFEELEQGYNAILNNNFILDKWKNEDRNPTTDQWLDHILDNPNFEEEYSQ